MIFGKHQPLQLLKLFKEKCIFFEGETLSFYRQHHYCHFKCQAGQPSRLALFVLLLHTWFFAAFLLPIFWLIWAYLYKQIKAAPSHEFAFLVGTRKPYAFVKEQSIWLNAKIECIQQNQHHIEVYIYLPCDSLKTLLHRADFQNQSKLKKKMERSLTQADKHPQKKFLQSKHLIDLKNISPEARYFLSTAAKASAM